MDIEYASNFLENIAREGHNLSSWTLGALSIVAVASFAGVYLGSGAFKKTNIEKDKAHLAAFKKTKIPDLNHLKDREIKQYRSDLANLFQEENLNWGAKYIHLSRSIELYPYAIEYHFANLTSIFLETATLENDSVPKSSIGIWCTPEDKFDEFKDLCCEELEKVKDLGYSVSKESLYVKFHKQIHFNEQIVQELKSIENIKIIKSI